MEIDEIFIKIAIVAITVIFVAALIFFSAVATVEPKLNNCQQAKECVCKINEKG